MIFFISVQTRMAKKTGFGQNIYTTPLLLVLHSLSTSPPAIQSNGSQLKKPRQGMFLASRRLLPCLLVQHIKNASFAKTKYLLVFANRVAP